MFKEYPWGKGKIIETIVPDWEDWVPKLLKSFSDNQQDCTFSHKIKGRWENSYLPVELVPEIRFPIRFARDLGVEIFCPSICMIYDAFDKSDPTSLPFWFNSAMPGKSTGLHDHVHHAALAGVVYLSCEMKSGNLYFHMDGSSELEILPEVGKLVLFEPWMKHGVRTNQSNQQRLSLAFNLRPFPVRVAGL